MRQTPSSSNGRPLRRRAPPALFATALALICAACTGGGISIGPFSAGGAAVTGTPGAPSIAIAAGTPIVVDNATPQLPAGNGQMLIPVAAYGSEILVRTSTPGSPSAASGYELWNPSSDALQPLPNWPAGSMDRVAGTTGNWLVLLRRQGSSVDSAQTVLLLNPTSGETRMLGTTSGNFGNPAGDVAVSDGWVAWTGDGDGHPGLHAYDVVDGVDHLLPVRTRGIARLAVGGGSIAWSQRYGGQPSQVTVRTIASGQTRTISTGTVDALALSSDGQTLAWLRDASSGAPGLFLSDLSTGSTGRLLGGQAVGVSLSASGQYLAWQPDPSNGSGVAGTYDVRTHELRLVQAPAGTTTRLARVLGNWFVWSARPAQTGGQGSPSSPPTYIFPLGTA